MDHQKPFVLSAAVVADLTELLQAIQAQAEISAPRPALRAGVALAGQALECLACREPLAPSHVDRAELLPGWMLDIRFSKRLAECLHREGYASPAQVLRDLDRKPENYWIRLPNFGMSCLHELRVWADLQPAPSLLARVVCPGVDLQIDTGLTVDRLGKGSDEREAFREHFSAAYRAALIGVTGATADVFFSDEEAFQAR